MNIADMLCRYETEILPKKTDPVREGFYIRRLKTDPWCLANDIRQIEPQHIAAFRDQRVVECGPRSALYELQLMSHATSVAMSEWGLKLAVNPFFNTLKPEQNPPRDRVLEDDEYTRLMKVLKSRTRSPWLYYMAKVAYLTSLRKGDLMRMRWDRIMWSHQTIKLDRDKTHPKGREVPVSKETLATLMEWREQTLGVGRVFPITENQFKMAWHRAKDVAHLPDFRFHDFRHTAITRFMGREDLTMQEVMTISGHKTTYMLLRYTHLRARGIASKL